MVTKNAKLFQTDVSCSILIKYEIQMIIVSLLWDNGL
jgi:hypothetical protein